MKRVILAAAALSISAVSFAQKSQIQSAKNYLVEQNYEKAKTAIEKAVNDESTKDNAGAWSVRGDIYLVLQQQPGNEGKGYYDEAEKSYRKAIALDPDNDPEKVNNNLFAIAVYNFNDGLDAYSKKSYDVSYAKFGKVVDIQTMDGGKRFSGKEWLKFDTVGHQSSLYQGYSAYYNNKFDDALQPLLNATKDPITKNPNVYLMLADIYETKKDNANLASILTEGRTTYPDDKTLENRELNYYISSNKSEELIKKLETAVTKEPNNADLLFTLGIAYDNMANPKDKEGKELPKPANYNDLFTKAEAAYNNALKVADKADINYNLGALYFNRAVMLNQQMNDITGVSAAEMKKYDGLKTERNNWFNKALVPLVKTVNTLEPQATTLKGEDKNTYMSALIAAKEIYANLNQLDKATEYKKKLDQVSTK